uniref:Ig-like domain-containing protein n=1 Tax=Accipiter nisus TaxID=211598 RepID=A0A8B9NJI5_9AVES
MAHQRGYQRWTVSSLFSAQWPAEILNRAGETVDISCYQNYTTLAYMLWYQQTPRNGLNLVASTSPWMQNSYEEGYNEAKFEINRNHNDHSVMTIKNVTSKDAATYFCAAMRVGNDKIIPPAVAIFSPSKQEIQQKSKATLVCLASGFYPDHLNLVWKVNGAQRTEGVGTDEFSTWNGSTYSLTSRLRISAQEWLCTHRRYVCLLTGKYLYVI